MDSSSVIGVLTKLGVVVLLALINGFFVAAEFALVGARRSRMETLAAEGNRRALTVLRAQDHLQVYVSATQFGITLASLALGWIGEDTLAHLLEPVFVKLLPASASAVAAHSIAI